MESKSRLSFRCSRRDLAAFEDKIPVKVPYHQIGGFDIGFDMDGDGSAIAIGDETQPRTLYVGNLDTQMTEEFLLVLFSQIGPVKGCKIIHEIFVVIGMISFEEVNSVMHWKAKPRNSRARVRPLRQSNHAHHSPSYRHRPIHRAHKPHPPPPPPPGYHRHRMPHHHVPIKSYQPPTSSMQYSPAQQQTSHSHPHSHVIKHPTLFKGQPTHFKQDEYFKEPGFTFSHAASSTSNIDHTTTPKFVSSSSDNQQHGYMASNYKGWRPIVKPYHSSYMHGAKYHGKDAYYNLYSPQNAGNLKNTGYENYNMNTLFRDSLKHVKPLKQVKLKPEYSENRGVVIPMPSEVGSNVRLPTSFFMDNSWNQFYNPTVLTSQSEESPVIRKPFPKFTARLKNIRFNSSTEPTATTMQANSQNDEGNRDDSGRPPPSVPKYKISKPKLRPHPVQQQQQQQQQQPLPPPPQKPEYNNEQEMDNIRQLSMPKMPDSVENSPQSQTPLNLKAKLSRGRTRVRTKQARPDGFVNTEEVSQAFDYHPAQSPVTSKGVGGRKSHKKEHSPNTLTDESPRNPFPTAPSNLQTESEESAKGGNNSSQAEAFPPFPNGFPMTPPDFFRNAVTGMDDNKDGRYEIGPTAPQTSNTIHDSQSTGPDRGNRGGPSRQHQRQQQRHREGGGGRRRQKIQNQNQNQNQNQHQNQNQNQHQNQNQNQHQNQNQNVNGNQNAPNKNVESSQAPPPPRGGFNENGGFNDEFYFPPGFNQDSSSGGNPVSFMTMPHNEKPQVIHHSFNTRQPSPTQQQLYPINVIRSPEYQKQAKPLQNIRAGPSLPSHNSHNSHNLNQNSHSHSPLPPLALESPGIHVPYQHPVNIRGTNQNGNYVRNNRPQYVILNIQNGKEQELGNPTNGPSGVDATYPIPNHTPIYPHSHSPQFSFGSNLSPQSFPHNNNAFQNGQHGLVPFTTLPSSPFFQNQGPAEAPTTLRSQFSGNDGGFLNSFPSAPPLRYEAFEATNGYPRQGNPFQAPSNQVATQLRQQLPRPQTRPFGPPNGNHRQQLHQESRHVQGPTSPRYSDRDSFKKNPADMNIFPQDDFENIPMEFLDQLRPILLGEEVMANSPIPATVTPATRQHVHQSPEIHPPSSFFDNFFQPFDENYRTETTTEQDVNNVPLTTPNNFPGKSGVRGGGQRGSVNRNTGYDMYKASSIKQYQVVRPNSNRSETSFPWPTNPTPVISFSPMHEFASTMSTVSPIHDIDFYSSGSNSPISWSKLKFGENGLSSTESFLPQTLSSQFRKPLNAFNQTKLQKPTKLGDKKNSFTSYNGHHFQEHPIQRQHYDVAPVTTYKPSFGNMKEMDVNTLRVENFPSVALQTTTEPSPLTADEDSVGDDSNTPRSVRIRTTTDSYDSQVTTESPEGLQSTSTLKSRRHFRKRRPDQTDRKRYFSSRVKQSIDSDSEKNEEPPVTTHRPGRTRSTSKTDENNNDDFEASRASVLRRRRLFPRRKNLMVSRTKTGSAEMDEEQQQQQQQPVKSTTPSSSEPEAVTYGESQWFKLKQPESSEDSIQPPLSKNDATTEKVQNGMQEAPSTNSFSKLLIRPQDIQLVPLITSSEALAEAELASTKPY